MNIRHWKPFSPAFAAALLAAVVLAPCGALRAQENPGSGEDIYIPRAGSLFESPEPERIGLDGRLRVATAADLLHPYSMRSASPAGPGTGGNPRYPVALASYEEEDWSAEDDPANRAETAKPVPLDWDWTPSSTVAVDSALLDQLQESIERTRKNLPPVAADAPRPEALTQLDNATGRLDAARTSLARIDERLRESRSAPDDLRRIEQEMASPAPDAAVPGENTDDVEVLQRHLLDQQQLEQRILGELKEFDSRAETRAKILATAAERRASCNEKLAAATRTITEQTTTDEPNRPPLLEGQAIAIACILEQRLIDAEFEWASTTEKLDTVRREQARRRLDAVVQQIQAMQPRIDELRTRIAQAEQERAQTAAANADPRVREVARRNAELAEVRTQVAEGIQSCKTEQATLDALIHELDTIRARMEKHISKGSHSRSVGLMLRYQRSRLPKTRWHREQVETINASFPEESLKQLGYEEELENLQGEIERVHGQIRSAPAGNSLVSSELLTRMADDLLSTRRTYLMELNSDYEKWLTAKSGLRAAHESCIEKIRGLQLYIDQHVLWIRSAEPLGIADFEDSARAVRSIVALPQWKDFFGGLLGQFRSRWPLLGAALFALFLVVGMKRQFNRRLRAVSRRRSDFRLVPIHRSMAMTVLQASFLPALVATSGWLLSDPGNAGSLQDSLSRSLLAITPQLFVGCILFRFCVRGGLAEAQLGWSHPVTSLIGAATGRIIRYCLPLVAVSHGLEILDESRWTDSLGRLTFIAAMLMFSWASLRLLRGIGRCWKNDPTAASSVWIQTFGLWAPLIVLAPLALAGMAALGYQYSAVFLAGRLLLTWWALLGTVAVYHLASRLIEIAHNRLYYRQVPSAIPAPAAENGDEVSPDQTHSHMQTVRGQVKGLVHVACIAGFVIAAMALWAEVMPAISALDIRVWGPIERQIQEQTTPDGPAVTRTVLQWITIGNLLAALVILAVTIVLSRNLPGLLEMIVLNRLPLDRGGRYAISIVFRYVVGIAGLVLVSRTIGVSWHGVQWLVAAMGVGLGFGLQEIFANFISGIIILLERPVRAGDLVTISNTTGTVHRIQLRATTIMDSDRRELIVPNKKFITDEVINWTLTDPITRVVIPVGIAYGSDTRLAQRTLLRLARQHPNVLKNPPPSVVFSAFAASSLNFDLRVFIQTRETFSDTVHDLHLAIDDEFRRQKIEIAFPQQEIHLKGIDQLLHHGKTADKDRDAA